MRGEKDKPILTVPMGLGKTMSSLVRDTGSRTAKGSKIITAGDGSNPVDWGAWLRDGPPPHKEVECRRVMELVLPRLDERASRLHPYMVRGIILMGLTQWSLERHSIADIVNVVVPTLNRLAASKADHELAWWR